MAEKKQNIFQKIADKFKINPSQESNQTVSEITQPLVVPSVEKEKPITPSDSETLEAETISTQPEAAPIEPQAPEEIRPQVETPEVPQPEAQKITATKPEVPQVRIIAIHTVRTGETLSHIALKYYGHATPPYYKLIYEFNKNVIGNKMNFIIPGQVLRIPAIPDDFKK